MGALIDKTCLVWRQLKCSNSTGACLLYDITTFRYVTHGVTLACMFVALIFAVIVYILIKKKDKSSDFNQTVIEEVSVNGFIENQGTMSNNKQSDTVQATV